MAKIAKVTDLTKLEGDPNPRKADVPNARMYLELRARAPWQVGYVKFVARCSERAPVARAIAASILLALGLVAAVVAHFVLAGVAPAWISAIVSLIFTFVPAGLYWVMTHWDRRSLPRCGECLPPQAKAGSAFAGKLSSNYAYV